MTLSNSLMGTPGIRRFVSLSLLLVLSLSCLVNLSQAKRSACWRYGHSCWGGHGKRSGSNGIYDRKIGPDESIPESSIESSSKVLGMFDKTTGHFLPLPILSLMMMSSVGSGTSGISNKRSPTGSPLHPPVRLAPTMMMTTMANWKGQNNVLKPHDILYPLGGTSNNKAYIRIEEKRNGLLTRSPPHPRDTQLAAGILGTRILSGGDGNSISNHEESYSSWPKNTIITDKANSLQEGKRDMEEIDGESPSDESKVSSSQEQHPYFDNSIFVRDRKRSADESKSPSSAAVFYTEPIPSVEDSVISNESIGNSADEDNSPEFQKQSSNSLTSHTKMPSQSQLSQPQLISHSPLQLSPYSVQIRRDPQSQIKLKSFLQKLRSM